MHCRLSGADDCRKTKRRLRTSVDSAESYLFENVLSELSKHCKRREPAQRSAVNLRILASSVTRRQTISGFSQHCKRREPARCSAVNLRILASSVTRRQTISGFSQHCKRREPARRSAVIFPGRKSVPSKPYCRSLCRQGLYCRRRC